MTGKINCDHCALCSLHVCRIDLGDKFTSSLSDSGELVLQILNFSWSDVGEYKAHIENQFGIATHIIKMDMSGDSVMPDL